MKRYLGIAILVAAVLGIAFVAFRPQSVYVEMGPVERTTVHEYVAEEAKTRLATEYTLDLPESGDLLRIELEVGDMVNEGDVVARLDTFDLEQQLAGIDAMIAQAAAQETGVDVAKPKPEDLESAAARVGEAENAVDIATKELGVAGSALAQAERDFARTDGLVQQGILSPAERDTARTALDAARGRNDAAQLALSSARKGLEIARLAEQRLGGSIDDNEYQRQMIAAETENLRAQRSIIENKIEKATVRAPVSGPILEKYVDSGRTLMAGTPLLKIGDLSTIEIECDVLSEEVGAIQEGNPVELLGKAVGGENRSGTVRRIHPAAFTKLSSLGIEQQRVKVLIDFDNTKHQLRPGTRLDVRIITRESANTIAVPERATFRREGQHYVFRVEGNAARLTPVTLGLRNDTWAEVLEGLDENATVIYEPMNELEDGAMVAEK
ncbi:MAG: hypothetical protein RLZZ303_2981 [Candidatus Hydrogenedentota bacterium]